ncbi:MAG: hypothetical protein N2556_10405, partial [Anaerolineae bacterium]|nr:hypothetical protein [Anaerolineae bacterium]
DVYKRQLLAHLLAFAAHTPHLTDRPPRVTVVSGRERVARILARYLGVDEDRVAGLLRTGVQAGGVLPGQAEGLAGILFRAVREGTREGVSTAETLQSMERHLQVLLAQGITGSERTLAAYAALVDRLNETQNRALMGEAGARALGNLVEGLTRTGVPGLEVLTLRAIGLP